MMPIPKSCLEKIELIKIKEVKYRNMLKRQIRWLNQNKLRIQNRARNLYYLISNKHATEQLEKRCCDFRLLERKCEEFMKENNLREDEILYKYLYA